ncbi:MAG TPA: FAD-dependent oxidoreductase, partial [Parasegetibacter sp.]
MTARTKKKEHIIILGGGAAGLNAARELATNCNVTILEAQGSLGGRINTIIPENLNHPIEAGAEFMHGQLPLTSKLIREAGVKSIPLEGKMFNVTSG